MKESTKNFWNGVGSVLGGALSMAAKVNREVGRQEGMRTVRNTHTTVHHTTPVIEQRTVIVGGGLGSDLAMIMQARQDNMRSIGRMWEDSWSHDSARHLMRDSATDLKALLQSRPECNALLATIKVQEMDALIEGYESAGGDWSHEKQSLRRLYERCHR